MTKPLALVFYENLLLGNQLVNRLQDMGYRVLVISDGGKLVETSEQEKPLVVIVDLGAKKVDPCAAIAQLRANPATSHLPILAFINQENRPLQEKAKEAGVNLIAIEKALLPQLPQLLEQVLQID